MMNCKKEKEKAVIGLPIVVCGLAGGYDVGSGPALQQQLHHVQLVVDGGGVHGRVAVRVGVVHGRASIEQLARHVKVAQPRSFNGKRGGISETSSYLIRDKGRGK